MIPSGSDTDRQGYRPVPRRYVLLYAGVFLLFVLTVTHSYPVEASIDRVVMADNVVMMLVQLCIMIMIGSLLWSRCRMMFWRDPLDLALMGVVIEAMGWASHRSYWALWRFSREMGWMEFADTMEGQPSLLVVGSFGLICLGGIMIISPMTRKFFGRHWPAWSVLVLATVYWAVYQIPDLLRG